MWWSSASVPELEDILKRKAEEQGRIIVPEPTPERRLLLPIRITSSPAPGVPALYIRTASIMSRKVEAYGRQLASDYVATRYHKPSDECSRPGICPAISKTPSCCTRCLANWPMAMPGRTGTKGTEFRANREATGR